MYDLIVSGMTCESCAGTVEDVLKSIDPNAKVSVDIGQQKITVNSNQSLDAIANLVAQTGYSVLATKKL